MRNIFIKKLTEEAKKNKNIYLLTGDLGYNSFEEFASMFPNQFINCGVAENNMVGISSGLALTGKKVFVYSIIPFLIFRSLEQIRNNICHNNLDVKIIGGGGGFSYGEQGISHNPTEDFAVVKSLPNIKIYSPGTSNETEFCIESMIKDQGPSFIRLGKVPEIDFEISNNPLSNKGNVIKEGENVLLLTTGNIISEAFKASKILEDKKIRVKIISFHSIKPLDSQNVIDHIKEFNNVFSIEEHNIIGGFGSSIEEILFENNIHTINFKKIGLNNKVHNEIGNQNYLRNLNNIDSIGIANFVLKNVK